MYSRQGGERQHYTSGVESLAISFEGAIVLIVACSKGHNESNATTKKCPETAVQQCIFSSIPLCQFWPQHIYSIALH